MSDALPGNKRGVPTTVPSTTTLRLTTARSTAAPSTSAPPTTAPSLKESPTTAPSLPAPPTTAPPTTASPTTASPTTAPPTTAPPTTAPPTTAPLTTAPPKRVLRFAVPTNALLLNAPSLQTPPITSVPINARPSIASLSNAPSTDAALDDAPSSTAPRTSVPPTNNPISSEGMTKPPTTLRIPNGLRASSGDPSAPGFRFTKEAEGRCQEYNPEYEIPQDVMEGISALPPLYPFIEEKRANIAAEAANAAQKAQAAYLSSQANAEVQQAAKTPRGSSRGRRRGAVKAARGARGSSRGRASNRKGASNSSSRQGKPTAGWTVQKEAGHTVITEKMFLESYVSQRVRLFVVSAVRRLKLELDVKNLTESRADVMILLIDELLQACLKWLNEFMRLKGIEGMELSLSEMYRYLAVLLYTHCSGFSKEKVIPMLEAQGGWAINKHLMNFIHNNVLAYSPTGRGGDTSFAWNPQRDQTAQLREFERKAFRMSSKICLSPKSHILYFG